MAGRAGEEGKRSRNDRSFELLFIRENKETDVVSDDETRVKQKILKY